MVFQAVLQVVGPMLLELVIREVAVPAAKRLVQSNPESQTEATQSAPIAMDSAAPRLQALSAVQVVSNVPGRVRFEVAGLRGQPELAHAIQADLLALDGVSAAEASDRTGRILVHFDATLQSATSLVGSVDRSRGQHLNRSGSARRLAAVV